MSKYIYRTKQIPVNCSKLDYEYLKQCNEKSAKVWNFILKIEKEYRKNNEGKWIHRNELQQLTKRCADLPAKCIHHVCYRYLEARDSAIKAKNGKGKNNRYPHNLKKYFATTWDYQQLRISNNYIKLGKEVVVINGKQQKQKPVKVYCKDIPKGIVQIELIYRNGLKLAIKYKKEVEYLQIKSENHAAIDLGEIHAITSIDSKHNAIIITGREIRSIKRFRNKELGKLFHRLHKTTKGSKQYWKYRHAIANLKEKADNKIKDCVHKISHLYLNYCLENNISTIYYGDLDSVSRNSKGRIKRFTGQKMSQWNRGELVRELDNKLSRYGINLIQINEAYTSQTCPNCGHKYHPTNRNYNCKVCGYHQHRDLVGSMNILNFNEPDQDNIKYYITKKYLRIA
jgi:putative transposase